MNTTEERSSKIPGAEALGRVPSGLSVLTARRGERASGMLASWVQQAGFEPISVTVAVKAGRFLLDWIAESGRFALAQLREGDRALLKHFARGFEPEADAFEGLDLLDNPVGGPVPASALSWLDLELVGNFDAGDHRLLLGRVVDGAVLDREAGPAIHVRKSGLHY